MKYFLICVVLVLAAFVAAWNAGQSLAAKHLDHLEHKRPFYHVSYIILDADRKNVGFGEMLLQLGTGQAKAQGSVWKAIKSEVLQAVPTTNVCIIAWQEDK